MTTPRHPDDDLLAALALDEEGVSDDVERHVATCRRCAGEVEELRHTLAVVLAPAADLQSPRDDLWAGVAAQVHDDPSAGTPAAPGAEPGVAEPGVAMPGVATAGVAEPGVTVLPGPRHLDQPGRRRGVPLVAALGLAAACLVVGGAVGRLLVPSPDPGAGLDADPSPTPSAGPVEVAVAELDAPDTDQALGRATVARSGPQTVLTLDLPEIDPQDGYLEVWLIDRGGTEMVAVGVVGDSWEPRFSIPRRLLNDGYVIVDVSRQSFDEGPEHSGDTVMRGVLST